MEKTRTYSITKNDEKTPIIIGLTVTELIEAICDGNGHLPDDEVGTTYTIYIENHRTQEELDTLPEYEGN